MSKKKDTSSSIKRKVQVVVVTRVPELQVLLLRRGRERGHIWQPVTGNVDAADRTLLEAGLRELEEETGITRTVAVRDTAFDFRFSKGRRQIFERLIAVEVEGPVAVTLSHEHVESGWFAPQSAMEMLEWDINRDGVRRVIGEVSGERSTP